LTPLPSFRAAILFQAPLFHPVLLVHCCGSGAGELARAQFADPPPLTWISLTWNRATATKADVENHFNTHGTGEITEIKLMNGFGFIEYKDAMDARDVVPGMYPSFDLI
jgi:hypothetical protein